MRFAHRSAAEAAAPGAIREYLARVQALTLTLTLTLTQP